MSPASHTGEPSPAECPFDLEAPHQFRRIDPEQWADIWLVGPVAGCRATLERLLACLSPGPDELVVLIGGLVGAGPDSDGVCRLVRDLESVTAVRGPADQRLVTASDGEGGREDGPAEALARLPLAITIGDTVVAHGGIDPDRPLAEHGPSDLVFGPATGGDGPHRFERHRSERRVAFGHTVLAEPVATPHAVGLDTGCVYGRRLTAYRLSTGAFVSVDSRTAHRQPAECDVVDPERARAIA